MGSLSLSIILSMIGQLVLIQVQLKIHPKTLLMSKCQPLTKMKIRFLSLAPPLEKNIIKDDSILQGANHKVRINAVPSDSAVPLVSSVSSVKSVPLVSFALS